MPIQIKVHQRNSQTLFLITCKQSKLIEKQSSSMEKERPLNLLLTNRYRINIKREENTCFLKLENDKTFLFK